LTEQQKKGFAMNGMTTLGKVRERVEEMSVAHTDNLVEVEYLDFESLETILIQGQPHHLLPRAQAQICARLGIPYSYLSRCSDDLAAMNLNRWLAHERNVAFFVRFDGDDIRAIFTPRYRPMDNITILERLEQSGFSPETHVQAVLDDEFLSLNIPDSGKGFKVNGDKMVPGISVCNSEVGLSALSVSAFVLRLVCTNGLISKTEVSASFRHISMKILDEFPSLIEKIGSELDRERTRFKISMESPVDDPESTLKSFNRQFALKDGEVHAVDWAWPQEKGRNMFAVVNTYTKAAQYPGLSAESSHKLMRVGGTVLGLMG